jgi:hypothetical protein
MMKAHNHLSDDQLIELCLGGTAHPVADCGLCEARRADLVALLGEVSASADEQVDAAFPADRLARQQARILQRLEQDGRPGRLITFPGHGQDTAPTRIRPGTRWIAAAAVAAFVIGLLTGHLAHDMPTATSGAPVARAIEAIDTAPPSTLRAVATTFSEDEFLVQIDLAADSPGPGTALRALHDVTPRAWDVTER